MDILLRLVGLAATVVFLAATALMLLTYRRARRVTAASLLVPVLVSLATLVLYVVLLRTTPSAGWLLVDLVAGAGLGGLWARSHTLFRGRDGGVRSRASLWFVVVWAAALTLNQVVVLAAGRSSPVLMGLLFFSTALAAGNGLALLLRLKRLRAVAVLALGFVGWGTAAGAEEVLLSLPREFDVQAIGGWYRDASVERRLTKEEIAGDPNPFRFRGEDVTQETSRVDHHTGDRCSVDALYHHEYKARFRRGELAGRWVATQRNSYRGCEGQADGEYLLVRHEGTMTGQANADGRLEVTVRVVDSTVSGPAAVHTDGNFKPWTFGLEFQLPVGGLQSSQALSPGPTPMPQPAVARGVGASPGQGDRGASVLPTAPGAPAPAADGWPGSGGEAADGPEPGDGDDPAEEEKPVSPVAAAGAAAGAAVLGLLGAASMLASSGVRPGELLMAPAEDFEFPVPPSDGDVRPETGEVWSEADGGWVGRNLYELERGQWRAEVEGAEAVSRDASRRGSAEIDRELRASRERERAAAKASAEAARVADLEASQRPEKIEPYQPAWSDRVTSALEWAEYGADSGVSLLGEITGKPGQAIGRLYTVTKETVKGTSEGVAAYRRGQGGAVAEEGSAWVILERATIGLTRGGAKVGLDALAGKVMDGVARVVRRPLPELPNVGPAPLVSVVREVVSDGSGGAARQTVGIALGRTVGSQQLQKPAGWAVEAATGEKL